MLYEDANEMWILYNISPELTCTCDEFHECQQCYEESKEDSKDTTERT
jgi:hypothetical protein